MSVRRLAEPALQPASFAFSRANAAWAKKTINKYPKGRQQSAVIPLLMRAQEQDGWVTQAAIEHVAEMLEMPLIRVLEVATFYTQYQLKPVGTKAHVQVCGTTPCMLRGSEALMDVCRKKIHPEQFHTNEAGTLSWEEVECLGACVNAPMVQINDDYYEDLTPESLTQILGKLKNGVEPTPGPQVDRVNSAPQGGAKALTDPALFDGSRNAIRTLPNLPAPAPEPEPVADPAQDALKAIQKTIASGAGAAAGEKKETAGERPPMVTIDPAAHDDLKRVKGIGPKNEDALNELGIYTFKQIAEWTPENVDWVEDFLSFPGRIERENWIGQAKLLAAGGETEFSKRVDAGEVPSSKDDED